MLYSDGVWSMPADALTLPPGYRLTSAVDINNAGQILAIASGPSASTRTFLLTPVPEPGGGGADGRHGGTGAAAEVERGN